MLCTFEICSLFQSNIFDSIAPNRWATVCSACLLFLLNNTFSLRDVALLLIHDHINNRKGFKTALKDFLTIHSFYTLEEYFEHGRINDSK
jgi:hypothetical protein